MKKTMFILNIMIIIIYLIINNFCVFAYTDDVNILTYGGSNSDYFYSIANTSDNGYIAVGKTFSDDITDNEKKGTPNSGALIVKYSSKDVIEWQKIYTKEQGGDSKFEDVIEDANNNYIAVGYEYTNSYNSKAIIIKYDKEGNLIWKKEYGTANNRGISKNSFRAIKVTSDNEYIVVGFKSSMGVDGIQQYGANDAIIIKYDSNGNIIWQYSYGGRANDYFNDVAINNNDEILVTGYSYSSIINQLELNKDTDKNTADCIIIKYDKNGKIISENKFAGENTDVFYSIEYTSDGGYIAGGYSYSKKLDGIENNGDFVAIIVLFDSSGNVKWQRGAGTRMGNCFNSVKATSQNEYFAVGYLTVDGTDMDAVLIKYNSNGEILQQDIYAGDIDDEIHSIITLKDKGYILVGYGSKGIEGAENKGILDGIIVKNAINTDEHAIDIMNNLESSKIIKYAVIICCIIVVATIILLILYKKRK